MHGLRRRSLSGQEVGRFVSSTRLAHSDAAGLNDTIAELSIKQSFRPSLADLSLHANRGPNTVKAPVTELSLPALDFSGGHYSRAVRTKRYNKNKLETKVFTKSERRHERADAANKKVSKTQVRSPVELA